MDTVEVLRLLVDADFSEAALDEALEMIGNPEKFSVCVHPYAKHFASHVAWRLHHDEKTLKPHYQIKLFPQLDEYEWIVSDGYKEVRGGLR